MKTIILTLFIYFALNGYLFAQPWAPSETSPQGGGITGAAVLPNGNIVVTTASYNWPTGEPGGIRLSTDGGHTWQNVVDCYTGRTLYVAGNAIYASCWDYPNHNEGLYKSTNNGLTWVLQSTVETGNNIFSILAVGPDTLYIGTRTGVRRSINGGHTFFPADLGIVPGSWIDWLEYNAGSDTMTKYIFTATSNGAYCSFNWGENWTRITGIPQSDTTVMLKVCLGKHRGGDTPGTNELLIGTSNGKIYKATEETDYLFATLGAILSPDVEISGFCIQYLEGQRIKYCSAYPKSGNNGGVYKSTNDGVNWTPINTGLPQNPKVSCLILSPNTLYTGLFENTSTGARIFKTTIPIGIQPISSEIPKGFSLSQNYPNPFNPSTNINFSIVKSSFVKLVVFDILGKEVETLVNGELKAGTYKADWNASRYTSGVYFYKLVADGFSETKKMLMIK